MDRLERRIRELEQKRKSMNVKLMDASTTVDANAIERELWAVRTAIAYYKSALSRERIDRAIRPPEKS